MAQTIPHGCLGPPRVVCDGGVYASVTQGISLGCPLSPLIGAIFRSRPDEAMEATGLFYARFIDDWVVLAPTRWKLRRAVRVINQILNELSEPPVTLRQGRVAIRLRRLSIPLKRGSDVGIASHGKPSESSGHRQIL